MDSNLINAIHWAGMAWANGAWAQVQSLAAEFDSYAVMFARTAMRQAREAEAYFGKCDPADVAEALAWL